MYLSILSPCTLVDFEQSGPRDREIPCPPCTPAPSVAVAFRFLATILVASPQQWRSRCYTLAIACYLTLRGLLTLRVAVDAEETAGYGARRRPERDVRHRAVPARLSTHRG